jgi:ubiquinone/menaquinone biosynthesis C-methylase UbiE
VEDNQRIEQEKKFWDKISPRYDRFIQKRWKIYQSSLPDKILGDLTICDTILEVACGTGLITFRVAKQAKKVYAVDISELMIEEAKKKMEEKRINNIDFSAKDAYSLPFEREIFDVVICTNALHNMKYPRKALSEIRRVLKPKGRFIATIVGIGESRIYKIIMMIYNVFVKIPVFHNLNLNSASDMIKKSGFNVAKEEIIKDPEDKMPLIYIVAEKG